MTIPTSAPPGTAVQIDTGPLSWVIGEIRESLGKSKASLNEALGQEDDGQSAALHHAKSFLHQAHGALQIVDIDGVAIITETIEEVLDRVESGQISLSGATVAAITNAYQALLEYLEELLSGAVHQPVRLFPYYRALLEVRGAERIHPADLFFPNLAIRPQLPAAPNAGAVTDYVGLRKRFERSLLPFLKSADAPTERKNAAAMREIVAEVERAQANQQSRAFWWVLHGFAEAVAAGQVANEIYVKQLFARINLQIRRLSEGSSSIAERLLRDALFFIARVTEPTPRVQLIRQAYQLDNTVPQDYEHRRYGQVDVNALSEAKERLSQAKTAWNRIAGGDGSVAQNFEQEMAGLAEAVTRLNAPALLKLVKELSGIARLAANAKPGDSLGLEMATSLLFVENALGRITSLPDNFNERAEAMTARLLSIVSGDTPSESAQWLDDMSREAQQRQTMTVLASELQTSLRQVEKLLEEYFSDPSQTAQLSQIESTLYQISGALAILDQEDAQRAIEHTKQAVLGFIAAGPDAIPDTAKFQHVAKNVGALSFFIETLQLNSVIAKKRFSFDDATGIFHANLLAKDNDGPLDVIIDEPVDAVAHSSEVVPSVVNEVQDLPTVEEDLALHQRQSAELALSLKEQPDNQALQEQLKETLQQVRMEATLVDNPEAGERAQAAMEMLSHLESAPAPEALADIVTATAPIEPVETPVPVAVAAPSSDEEVDAELLEIFLGEAEEVLGCVKDTIPDSRNEPYNQDHLTTLRRSFHTLKGSGRMVGLMAFGEAAWSIEQVLNLRLSETRAGDADLYSLLDKAVEVLGAWVVDLQATGRSSRTPHALVAAAERIKNGHSFLFEDTPIAVAKEEVPAPSQAISHTEPQALVATGDVAAPEAAHISPEDLAAADQTGAADAHGGQHDNGASAEPVALDLDLELPLSLAQAEDIEISEQDLAALRSGHDINLDAVAHKDAADETPMAAAAAPTETAQIIDFPVAEQDDASSDDNVKHIGELEISVPLHNIYLAETDELVRLLSQDIAEWRHEPDRHVNVQVVHAAHSLAGSSATVGFKPLQEVAHGLESILQFLARKPVRLNAEDYDTLEHGVERIRFMLQMFALGEMPGHEPEQVQILERMQMDIEARLKSPPVSASHPELPSFELPVESPIETSIIATPEQAHDTIEALPALNESSFVDALEVAPILEMMPELTPTEQIPAMPEAAYETQASVPALQADDLPAFAEPVPVELQEALDETAPAAEPMVHELTSETPALPTHEPVTEHVELAVPPEQTDPIQAIEANDAVRDALNDPVSHEIGAHEASPEQHAESASDAHPPVTASAATHEAAAIAPEVPEAAVVAEVEQEHPVAAAFVEPMITDQDAATLDPALLSLLRDELDPDLLPVFLEEGRDMLPQMERDLRTWQQKPTDALAPQSLLRVLHTVKGSARMAGAMTLGQHMHEMETRIEQVMRSGTPSPAMLEELLSRYDQGQQMFEFLQNPDAARQLAAAAAAATARAEQALTVPTVPVAKSESVVLQPLVPIRHSQSPSVAAPTNVPATPATPAAATPLVRVRADILDRLVNQAGEVSISRSKLETEVVTLRQSLGELTDNVVRLRNQLREIEMQAESQISSRMAHSGEREFDPLEFDRFTRLQELTRMMAESVNDVSSVQTNLARTVESATNDLTTQGRLTRDLQQDLMRVRMVQFASISERLYRVTRQASKELDKRVNLDIRGSAVEVDRSVLEKMTGPFEHLLRNAIVHGIETREGRQAAGKSEIGELLVEIRQEGNEVVIQFSDDGRGLNIEGIRKKAISVGLLNEADEVNESEVTDLIFHPGFSTAEQVTELAGRGVGMDVVRSEAAALGGRVEVTSEFGKGAHFTIHLPLTLAVTQVVLLSSGGKTYAVPSVLVEQVQQLKANPLATAYNDGAVIWQNQRVPMFYLPALLGDRDAAPKTQQYSPIIILKSGNDRVAVHVDEIMGNREVVVKNIGPQLARLIGIAGATVLGSGEIVLILNPVPLSLRAIHEPVRAPRLTPSDAPEQMGAVAELTASVVAPVKSEPVQGLRHQHIVMVVDDSLTVRRVTQRLLVREGYQVVLAKDGVDALEHLQSITPDVMLVDIEMPRMDGFDLTRNVRDDERTKRIPIIMITSRTASKHRNYAMELGVNEYLGKPYQEDTLLSLIAGFVAAEKSPA